MSCFITLFPPLSIDINAHKVFYQEEEILLSNREFELLLFLAKHNNETVTFEVIGKQIWGSYSDSDRRAILVNTSRLRKILDQYSGLENIIETVHESVSHVNTFLCYNISETPWHMMKNNFTDHNYLLVIAALLIPVVSYLTQVLNIKMMPQAEGSSGSENDAMAQQMKMMNRTMPLFSLIMCFTVPVGLGIYWIASALVRAVQQFALNKHFEKVNLDDIIKKNQEKAKKKREKMGIAENQISNAAHMNTRRMEDKKQVTTSEEKEQMLEKAAQTKANAKPGSMAAKANMVREFNERNNKKN